MIIYTLRNKLTGCVFVRVFDSPFKARIFYNRVLHSSKVEILKVIEDCL